MAQLIWHLRLIFLLSVACLFVGCFNIRWIPLHESNSKIPLDYAMEMIISFLNHKTEEQLSFFLMKLRKTQHVTLVLCP